MAPASASTINNAHSMRSLTLAFTNTKMLLTASLFGLVEVAFFPNWQLVWLLIAAMFIDLLTGLIKSWNLGKATTSIGFRRTVTKLVTYVSIITGMYVLAHLLGHMYGGADYSPLVNLTTGFLSFIELYSVFENIYAIAPNGMLARKLVRPILKRLGGLIDQADKTLSNYVPEEPTDKPGDGAGQAPTA